MVQLTMSKNVNVKILLQRVIAASLFVLALWILYSKLVGDDQTLESADTFRNPSIARTTPLLSSNKVPLCFLAAVL